MSNKTVFFPAALLFLVLVDVPKASLADDTNALADASFEMDLAAADGGWIPFDESMYSTKHARTGQRSMFNWGYSRSVSYPPYFIGTVSGSYQEFAASPGSQWRLTGYGLIPTPIKGGPAFGIVQMSFFDEDGNDLGTLETAASDSAKAKISNEVNSESPAGEWVFLDTGIATAPEGTAFVQAFTLYVDFSGSDTSQGVYFDDLSLCAIADEGQDRSCKMQ